MAKSLQPFYNGRFRRAARIWAPQAELNDVFGKASEAGSTKGKNLFFPFSLYETQFTSFRPFLGRPSRRASPSVWRLASLSRLLSFSFLYPPSIRSDAPHRFQICDATHHLANKFFPYLISRISIFGDSRLNRRHGHYPCANISRGSRKRQFHRGRRSPSRHPVNRKFTHQGARRACRQSFA